MRRSEEEIRMEKDGQRATAIRSAFEGVWKHKGWVEVTNDDNPKPAVKKQTKKSETPSEEEVLDAQAPTSYAG